MDYAAPCALIGILEDRQSLFPGVPGMDNNGHAHFLCQFQLFSEGPDLDVFRRIVLKEIETDFSVANYFPMFREEPYFIGNGLIKLCAVVGMYAHCAVDGRICIYDPDDLIEV